VLFSELTRWVDVRGTSVTGVAAAVRTAPFEVAITPTDLRRLSFLLPCAERAECCEGERQRD